MSEKQQIDNNDYRITEWEPWRRLGFWIEAWLCLLCTAGKIESDSKQQYLEKAYKRWAHPEAFEQWVNSNIQHNQ